MPTPVSTLSPASRDGSFGAISVICTGTGNAPAGMTSVTWPPGTLTALMAPPTGAIVRLVTTAE